MKINGHDQGFNTNWQWPSQELLSQKTEKS